MVKTILIGSIMAAARRIGKELREEELNGLKFPELLECSQLIVAALTVEQNIGTYDMVMRAVERAENEAELKNGKPTILN